MTLTKHVIKRRPMPIIVLFGHGAVGLIGFRHGGACAVGFYPIDPPAGFGQPIPDGKRKDKLEDCNIALHFANAEACRKLARFLGDLADLAEKSDHE